MPTGKSGGACAACPPPPAAPSPVALPLSFGHPPSSSTHATTPSRFMVGSLPQLPRPRGRLSRKRAARVVSGAGGRRRAALVAAHARSREAGGADRRALSADRFRALE